MSRETCNNIATNLQRAIENIESAFEDIRLLGADALSTALAAMREQQEREKGCGYCLGDYPSDFVILDIDNEDVTADDITVEFAEPLRFCPMCGKRLKENNHAR